MYVAGAGSLTGWMQAEQGCMHTEQSANINSVLGHYNLKLRGSDMHATLMMALRAAGYFGKVRLSASTTCVILACYNAFNLRANQS
jgi:hypothetical protein